MGILARILVVAALSAALVACARGSDDTVESFFREIDRGELAVAVARFSPSLREKFGEEQLEAAVARWSRDLKAHGGLAEVNLTGGVVTFDQLALYDVTLSFGDGTAKRLQTSLVHVDGDWYINSAL